MHFCQDELFVILMAVQNGPRNIWRYIVGKANAAFRFFFPKRQTRAFDEDMRVWQQSQLDLRDMRWDKDQRRWVRKDL